MTRANGQHPETITPNNTTTSRDRPVRVALPVAQNVACETLQSTGEVSLQVSPDELQAGNTATSPQTVGSELAGVVDHTSPLRSARGYSWPPFEAGNTAAVTHGISSPRMVDPIVRRIKRELRSIPELDYLSTPRFAEPLERYARVAAQSELIESWMADKPMELLTDSVGGKTSPLELSRLLTSRAIKLAAKCGLSPLIADDVQHDIDAARVTLARRVERAHLQADLRADLAHQWFGDAE